MTGFLRRVKSWAARKTLDWALSQRREYFVSVIVAVFNGEKYLAEALKSIFDQTYRHFEVILVDDGSTDRSAEIARSFKGIRYFYQPNQGPAKARNFGIANSKGAILAFLDQDDLWLPGKLSAQIGYLHKHPQAGYVFAKQKLFFEENARLPELVKKLWEEEKKFPEVHVGYLPGTFVVRRSVFDKVGPFDESLLNTSDADWFFRAKDRGIKSGIVQQVLLLKRFHDANSCYRADVTRQEILRVIRSSIHHSGRGNDESSPKN